MIWRPVVLLHLFHFCCTRSWDITIKLAHSTFFFRRLLNGETTSWSPTSMTMKPGIRKPLMHLVPFAWKNILPARPSHHPAIAPTCFIDHALKNGSERGNQSAPTVDKIFSSRRQILRNMMRRKGSNNINFGADNWFPPERCLAIRILITTTSLI